jgi:hypothetical protein
MIKKSLLFFVLCLCFFSGNAQSKMSFSNLRIRDNALDGKFKNYKILELNEGLQRIADGRQMTVHFDRDYSFTLKENRLFGKNYIVTVKGENGISRKTLDEIGFDGQYFMNEGISDNNQLVFSMFEDRYSFYIKSAEREFYIEPLRNLDKSAASNLYVYYEVQDIIYSQPFDCGTKDENHTAKPQNELEKNIVTGGCKTVGINFFIDYSMFATYGTVNGAINRTLEILNLSQANYTIANGLSDDVVFKASEHYIVTCDPCNYWPSTLEIHDNFDSFSTLGYYVFFDNPQDKLKVMFQNEGGTGTVVGLASPFTCGVTSTTVVKNYAANTDLTRQILSHEMGHNLGCQHTDGFIMNVSVNYATNWAPESIATLNNTLNTLPCIANCNPLPCDGKRVSDIVIIPNTDTDQVTMTWLSEPGIVYKMRLFDYSAFGWTDYTTLAYPANSITYPISQTYCTDKYRFMIVAQCGDTEGIAENVVFNVSQDVAAPSLINWTGFRDYFNANWAPYEHLCSGKTYYCSITGVDAGTAPVYQWKVNGINVGTNSNTLTIDTLQNNDVVSCELTSNATCIASPAAFFSTVVSVVQPTTLSISYQNISSTTICAGENITINELIDINENYGYSQFGLVMESFFNDQPIDTSDVYSSFDVVKQFQFAPSESGVFYSRIDLGTWSGSGGTYPYCYTNQTASSPPLYITVNPQPCGLAVSDFDISGLAYYPNPAQDILSIEAKETIADITIYTTLGQAVKSKTINSNQATLDLSALANGVYFLKIRANGKMKTVKIVKN